MQIKKWLPFLMFFVMAQAALAQEKEVIRRRVIVQQGGQDNPNKIKDGEYPHHAIALNPLLIFTGEYQITYQYSPLQWLALEVGGGITRRHLLLEIIDLIGDESFEPTLEDATLNTMSRPAFMAALKIFPEDDFMWDGYFIGLQYNHRNYVSEYVFDDPPAAQESDVLSDVRVYNDLGLTVGWQYITSIESVFIETYFGAAVRNVQRTKVVRDLNHPNFEENVFEEIRSEKVTIGGLFGVKVGVFF